MVKNLDMKSNVYYFHLKEINHHKVIIPYPYNKFKGRTKKILLKMIVKLSIGAKST